MSLLESRERRYKKRLIMTNFIRTMCHSAPDNVDVMLAVSTSVQKPSTVDTILISQGDGEETNTQTNKSDPNA